jgi:uncharacterized protein
MSLSSCSCGVIHLLYAMEFEWDERKELTNRAKHGVEFDTALQVFSDPNRLLVQDRIDDETGETRWHALGLVKQSVLLVVHVYRSKINGQEIIRILSARKANKNEVRRYLG